jgi:hypothetical protein
MFCRYCGAYIPEDSLFCAKCGKRLGKRENPRLAKIVRTLRLKTPYPYFGLLLLLFIVWAIGPRRSRADYSHLKWSIELDKKNEIRDENLYQQAFSLVVENTGGSAVQGVRVDLTAKIEPQKPADVLAGFQGQRLYLLQRGVQLPLTMDLIDSLPPGTRKRYFLEGSIEATPPFKVTYEIREENQKPVLASYVIEQ